MFIIDKSYMFRPTVATINLHNVCRGGGGGCGGGCGGGGTRCVN